MVHGFMGSPNGGWRPWLMGELEKDEVYACALPMPNPNYPKKEEWVKTIADVVADPEDEIFLVGHSLGVPAILHYLQSLENDRKINGVVLVSGPVKPLKVVKYPVIDTFLDSFDFTHIKKVCKNFCIIHGDNDDKVPFNHAEELSKNLNCKLITIPNGGHLNGSAGWTELPEVLEALKEMF